MKAMKRVLSLLLVISMLMSNVTTLAFAADTGLGWTADKNTVAVGGEDFVTLDVTNDAQANVAYLLFYLYCDPDVFAIEQMFDPETFEMTGNGLVEMKGKYKTVQGGFVTAVIDNTADSYIGEPGKEGYSILWYSKQMPGTTGILNVNALDVMKIQMTAKNGAANGDYLIELDCPEARDNTEALVNVGFDGTQKTITVTGGIDMITSVDLTADQLPAPVKFGTPVTSFTGTGYTGAVTWKPAVTDKFAAGTAYTAEVTLTATGSYVFKNGIVPTVAGAEVKNVVINGTTMTFDAVFGETAAKELVSIEIATPATKLDYIEGQDFDATGMKVNAIYDDNTTEENVAATVTDGTGLTAGKTSVTVTYGGKTATQAITVSEKPSVADATVVVSNASELVYDGNDKTPAVTVTYNGTELTKDTDYTVSVEAKKDAGTYELTVNGIGNYKDTKNVQWTIQPMDVAENRALAEENIVAGVGTFTAPTVGAYGGELVYTYNGSTYGYDALVTELAKLNAGAVANVAYSYTASGNYSGAITGTLKLTVIDVEFSVAADALTFKAEPTYGDTWGKIITGIASGKISATLGGAAATVDGEYSVLNENEIPNAGTGETAPEYTIVFTGAINGKNYNEVLVTKGTVNVNPKKVTVSGITAADREYNGTNVVELSGGTVDGLVGSDTLSVDLTGVYGYMDDKHIGTNKSVDIRGLITLTGHAAANYSLDGINVVTVNITAKDVTITDVTAADKTYDGNTTATVTGTAVVDGALLGDDVTVTAGTATFADKNVGTKTVTFTGFALSGADAGNYKLTEQPAAVTADITAKDVTVSGIAATNRGYNGTNTVELTDGTVDGKFGTDDVTVDLTGATGTMTDANVGTGKAVTVTGVALGGADAANYNLTDVNAVTVDIAKAAKQDLSTSVDILYSDTSAKTYTSADILALMTNPGEGTTVTITDFEAAANEILSAVNKLDEGTAIVYNLKEGAAYDKSVVITIKYSSNNFADGIVTLTINTVNKTELTVSGVTVAGKEYDGQPIEATGTPVAKNGEDVVNVDFTYEWYKGAEKLTGAPKDAGEYSLIVKVSDSDPLYMGAQEKIDFVIAPQPVVAPTANTTVFTYNREKQTYTLAPHPGYEVSGNEQTNAGTYTVTVALKDNNYKWAHKAERTPETYDFVIGKQPVARPTAEVSVVFNGEEQSYGYVTNDYYTVAGTTSATNVSTNDITVTLKDDDNYKWSTGDEDEVLNNVFKITHKLIAKPTQAAAVTYNGKEQTYGVAETADYTVTIDSAAAKKTNANEAGYPVVIALTDAVNTMWNDETTANITDHKFIIKKANLAIVADNQDVQAGSKELPKLTYTVFGLQKGDALGFEPVLAYQTTPDLTKPGEVTITITGSDYLNDNYNKIEYVYATLTITYVNNSEPSYGVEIDQPENGTIKLSNRTAEAGEKVTITVTPDKGYELVELIVLDRKGNEIKVTETKDGKFTFKMPAGKVEILPVFEKIGGEEEIENPFTDVAEKDYFYDAVLWAAENGITNGMTANTFAPGAVCNRAQVVTFLWRAAGCPEPKSNLSPFVDVAPDAYYYDAVLWAVENGITNGMSATEFAPNATVTRGQTVTFLWRAERGDVAEGMNAFTDIEADAYYYSAVQWAVKNGITNGMSNTSFAPANGCTRGQIVTFLYRTFAE